MAPLFAARVMVFAWSRVCLDGSRSAPSFARWLQPKATIIDQFQILTADLSRRSGRSSWNTGPRPRSTKRKRQGRANTRFVQDTSYGMIRTEIRCTRCEATLGMCSTMTRCRRNCFGMNSVSMQFVAEGQPLPATRSRRSGGQAPSITDGFRRTRIGGALAFGRAPGQRSRISVRSGREAVHRRLS